MIFFLKQPSKIIKVFLILIIVSASACSTNQKDNGAAAQTVNTNVSESTDTRLTPVKIEKLTDGLDHPWGMAFLPDGRLLITEREGQLRILDKNKKLSDPISGMPKVFNEGQGGLLDVVLDPDFKTNSFVYFSFSEPGPDNTASTALGRGKFENDQIKEFKVLFRQKPKLEGPNHFGSRIVFSPDGYIFLTTGERFQFDPAQDLSNHLGKIVRLNKDGSIPGNNPFINKDNAEGAIWSYGHRNIESAAIDPNTGKLWIAEMGPKGGDELNQPEAGKNYGWPVVSWGNHYDGKDIPDPDTKPELADAKVHWTPVISPSGMRFYTGEMFPEFIGNMLIGGLTAKGVVRVQVTGEQAKEIGRIDVGSRVRDVEQGPDGSIYVLTDKDNGEVLRLVPDDK